MEKKLEEVINRLEAVKEEVARLEALVAGLKAAEPTDVDAVPTLQADPADADDPIDLTLDETDFVALAPAVLAEGEPVYEGGPGADAAAETVPETAFVADDAEPVEIPVELEDIPVEVEDLPVVEQVDIEDISVEAEDLPAAERIEKEDIPVEAEDLPTAEPAEMPVDAEDLPALERIEKEDLPVEAEESEPEDGDDLFGLFGEELAPVQKEPRGRRRRESIAEAAASTRTVADSMAVDVAWRTDIPGPEVRSLRSAIALGDQVLFIARLFRKDSALYQDTVDRLNATATLTEAIGYLSETFPEWDLGSEDVYKFMMAVRRKIRR